jgi:hypothetical protein
MVIQKMNYEKIAKANYIVRRPFSFSEFAKIIDKVFGLLNMNIEKTKY